MSNLSCGTHVAEPSANKDCRKLLNQFCRFLPKLKLPISADAKLPLTAAEIERLKSKVASLEDQLYWLRKKMFGKMSEKNLPLDPTVLSGPTLFDDPLTEGLI